MIMISPPRLYIHRTSLSGYHWPPKNFPVFHNVRPSAHNAMKKKRENKWGRRKTWYLSLNLGSIPARLTLLLSLLAAARGWLITGELGLFSTGDSWRWEMTVFFTFMTVARMIYDASRCTLNYSLIRTIKTARTPQIQSYHECIVWVKCIFVKY